MKLLDIRNNLAKISYESDEPIALGKFIVITDNSHSYVAQMVNLKADETCNYAIAKLIFTFNQEGIVDNYDGSIPSLNAEISYLNSNDILKLLPIENPIIMGKLAQQEETLRIDSTLFERNLTICAEKCENICTIVNNAIAQLESKEEKLVVIDTDGSFEDYKTLRLGKDFKIPLNYRMIDYIYENDLIDIDATSRAVIQEIFYEVQEYTKSVPLNFIPFDKFVNVVSEQYQQTEIPELALLKNKLLKYQDLNIFAQTAEDVKLLENSLKANNLTYIDISDQSDNLQAELISYIHDVLNSLEAFTYNFVKLNNHNSNKKLLKKLLNKERIFTTVICSHNYKYIAELKQHSENLIFFAPQTIQHDFASYNTLLNKISPNEFIIYGSLTQNIPFIVELSEYSPELYEEEIEENKEEDVSSVEIQEYIEEPVPETLIDANTEITELEAPTIESEPETEIMESIEFEDEIENILKDESAEQPAETVSEIEAIDEEPQIQEAIQPDDDLITENDLDFIDNNLSSDENIETEITQDIENSFNPIEELPMPESASEEIPAPIEMEPETDLPNFQDEFNEDLPIYPAEETSVAETSEFEQGDTVMHPKYGKGVVEKLIKYGNKTLCSISFEQVGKRLLDPAISELKKSI